MRIRFISADAGFDMSAPFSILSSRRAVARGHAPQPGEEAGIRAAAAFNSFTATGLPAHPARPALPARQFISTPSASG
jgi:hypothetical protein